MLCVCISVHSSPPAEHSDGGRCEEPGAEGPALARVTVKTVAAGEAEADVVPADHLTAGAYTVSRRHAAFGEEHRSAAEAALGGEADLLWPTLGQNVPAAAVEGRLRTVETVQLLTQDSRIMETQNQSRDPAEMNQQHHSVPENTHSTGCQQTASQKNVHAWFKYSLNYLNYPISSITLNVQPGASCSKVF